MLHTILCKYINCLSICLHHLSCKLCISQLCIILFLCLECILLVKLFDTFIVNYCDCKCISEKKYCLVVESNFCCNCCVKLFSI